MKPSELELRLGRALLEHPLKYNHRFTDDSKRDLLKLLFNSLTGFNDEYLRVLFPDGLPDNNWRLSEAQGAKEGAEYSEAARGKRCGHVFKNGEASYRCMTCSVDETCALCSRCFDASDHTGHKYSVYVSSGHSGCCDCGDDEAFRLPVNCAIHTDLEGKAKKEKASAQLPADFLESVRTTIARAFDYFCDVISCSPEQLRLPKTTEKITHDEANSRLSAAWYGGSDEVEDIPEYALVLWNDEKHTISEVKHQVARACRESEQFGINKANETNDIGRSVVKYSEDLGYLLGVSAKIEQIRITVTVRSSRDTYREQMCDTIIEWFSDIAACNVAGDNELLRQTICEEMLRPWRPGSRAWNAGIGKKGIDDHSREEGKGYRAIIGITTTAQILEADFEDDDDANDIDDANEDEDEGEDDDDEEEGEDEDEDMDVAETVNPADTVLHNGDQDIEMETEDDLEVAEATLAGYPPPPPPPQAHPDIIAAAEEVAAVLANPAAHESFMNNRQRTPPGPEEPEEEQGSSSPDQIKIPKTPGMKRRRSLSVALPYWEAKPSRYYEQPKLPYENIRQRTRLDWLILYDLRLWKKTRTDVRELCLGTVVNVPEFKRILGLRFSALYTALAQLYLIADREPDHSIINLSLQLLTTPSITEEVVERGNFLANIMAILYTFLTTRQVGEPRDVNPAATLAMDSGSITNRRLYHFFLDLRYLLPSEFVQSRIRTERQYFLQFLDLVKLPQGICPNVRAVGEHVEYETDSWISASILMREINRLCRLFCESFQPHKIKEGNFQPDRLKKGHPYLCEAIITAAVPTMVISVGAERKRFEQAEIKEQVRFKTVPYVDFEIDAYNEVARHRVVDFVVERGSLSFHHPLHYTLSWLLECGRSMSPETVRELLLLAGDASKQHFGNTTAQNFDADDIIMSMFDYPLRVCAWLAQLKAGMWVRNGLSLRHQMGQYRAVMYRDVAYYRDIFMLQTAFAVCDQNRFLAAISDRFGITEWMKAGYMTRQGYDDQQHIDVAEEFIHLLVILVSERTSLMPLDDEAALQRETTKRDIAHILCFKPLPFSDLTNRISDRLADADDFQDILEEVANFRAPDGLNDSGAFELKPEYTELIDPYAAQYSKNQRDEAENIYKQWVIKNTGKKASDVVFEPKLKAIKTGLFSNYSRFTQLPLFAQIIHQSLEYSLMFKLCTNAVAATRIEAFLHVVLHLLLLATIEDESDENAPTDAAVQSFVAHALTRTKSTQLGELSIIGLLQKISTVPEFESCGTKICHILKRLWQKRPKTYAAATEGLTFPYDKIESDSPAPGASSEADLKKKRALDRQARIMAQFQQQQQTFLSNQGNLDWGEEEFSEPEEPVAPSPTEKKLSKYPSGNCILCQEETNDSRLYGTFALVTDSAVLRQTDLGDQGFVREVLNTPSSLDRSADAIRPFGVAGENREQVRRLDSTGGEVISEKIGLGRGFPSDVAERAPVMTGCGHIMHYSCFEAYFAATQRRHQHQVTRNHPERPAYKEFVCPLCKALGNSFLPIVWKGKEESYPGALNTDVPFDEFLSESIVHLVARFRHHALIMESDKLHSSGYQKFFVDYISKNFIPPLSQKAENLIAPPITSSLNFPPSRMPMPGLFPVGDDIPGLSPLHQVSTPGDSAITELVGIYRRLRETVRLNKIPSRFAYNSSTVTSDDLVYTDALIKSFGTSISAVEIAQRGIECEPGTTLLNTIPQISLTHLRILAESALSYASIGGLHNTAANKTVYEFRDIHRRKLCQLFLGHPGITGFSSMAESNQSIEPFFSLDTFVFLAECSLTMVPVLNVDIIHVIRICYIAEIVKAVFSFILRPQELAEDLAERGALEHEDEHWRSQRPEVLSFFRWMTSTYKANSSPSDRPISGYVLWNQENPATYILKALEAIAKKYALPFLRKSAILLHVQYGVEYPNTGVDYADLSELDRLTTLLRLPSVEQIFESFVSGDQQHILGPLATGWIAHWHRYKTISDEASVTPSLSHPAILELVGLPKYFDTLIEEANQRKCPSTGKELTDPCVCLFCGEIFCSQAVCCQDETSKLGGCNRHVLKCGQNIGLFINIRKCAVLLLHGRHGAWQFAPYLDIHGEVDPGFRHHRRLILNQKRYDRLLRDVWLTHSVPATVSRRLEADINNGGWETL